MKMKKMLNPQPLHIKYVEDTEDTRHFISIYLQKEGSQTQKGKNNEETNILIRVFSFTKMMFKIS